MPPHYYLPRHQGLELNRPEIVPFRLTPNMVDAMGLTGIEGTYRRSTEVCMGLLRDNRWADTTYLANAYTHPLKLKSCLCHPFRIYRTVVATMNTAVNAVAAVVFLLSLLPSTSPETH